MSDVLSPPMWVDTSEKLHTMIQDLASQTRVAVDTESNSLHAFRERVCLIQFSTPKKDYVVDPFMLQDLSPLAPIFANPNIEKIFHAAEYDLVCLRRVFGFDFASLFDTMQAARVLGYSFVGLDNILADKFGVKIDKRHQKADWGARPLTPAQIDYARFDTHYLFQLRDLLEGELREKDRWDIALEDFSLACRAAEPKEKVNGASWKKFSMRKDLTLRELTILSELCACRDEIAEKLDRPPFKVVGDDILLEVARNLPEKDVDLSGLGMSSRQIHLWGGDILTALRRGVEAPLVKREQVKRPSDAVLRRLERLKNWRKKQAKELAVESDIVLPKMYLSRLAENPPQSIADLETVMSDAPMRFRQYGSQIYSLIGGN